MEQTQSLLIRLKKHIEQMAPHQRDRQGGKLMIEAAKEIEALQETATKALMFPDPEIICQDKTAKEIMAITFDKWVPRI